MPLLLEILGNMCIAIVYKPGCDAINFEIILIFLIKSFLLMTKESRQELKPLKKKNSFEAFFIIFKGLLVAKNCFRPESAL